MKRPKSVVLIGGSGFWSDQNHIASMLEIGPACQARISAIVDPVDPATMVRHANLQKLLRTAAPQWVNPSDFSSVDDTMSQLAEKPDLVVVSCNPEAHYEYAEYCIAHGIHTLIDKPINVRPDAPSSMSSARQIYRDFSHLLNMRDGLERPGLALTLLRRRTLAPFRYVAGEVAACYRATGQGVTHVNLIVNGGIHKFPSEFADTEGAHGYHSGVGSLSHSAYHYIDVLTWLLEAAPGNTRYLRIGLNSVKRISDYIATEGYAALGNILGIPNALDKEYALPRRVLDAELDSSFTIELLDGAKSVIGHMNFVFSHTTFTPRTRPVQKGGDHANFSDGGRMSHVYVDVQQGAMQSWQVNKNDIVFKGNNISLEGRRHPLYSKETLVRKRYQNAYEDVERPLSSLLRDVLLMTDAPSGGFQRAEQYVKDIADEKLNMQLYAAFYELLAADKKKLPARKIELRLTRAPKVLKMAGHRRPAREARPVR